MREDQLFHHLDSAGLTRQAEVLAQSHAAVRKKLHQKSSRLQKVGDLVPVASLQHFKEEYQQRITAHAASTPSRTEEEAESTKGNPAKVAKERESIARATIQHEMQALLSSTAEVFGFIGDDADREQYCNVFVTEMAKAYHALWVLLLQTRRIDVQLPTETREMMAYLFQLIQQRRNDIVRRLQIKRTSFISFYCDDGHDLLMRPLDMVRMALLPIIAIDTRLRVLFRKELSSMLDMKGLLQQTMDQMFLKDARALLSSEKDRFADDLREIGAPANLQRPLATLEPPKADANKLSQLESVVAPVSMSVNKKGGTGRRNSVWLTDTTRRVSFVRDGAVMEEEEENSISEGSDGDSSEDQSSEDGKHRGSKRQYEDILAKLDGGEALLKAHVHRKPAPNAAHHSNAGHETDHALGPGSAAAAMANLAKLIPSKQILDHRYLLHPPAEDAKEAQQLKDAYRIVKKKQMGVAAPEAPHTAEAYRTSSIETDRRTVNVRLHAAKYLQGPLAILNLARLEKEPAFMLENFEVKDDEDDLTTRFHEAEELYEETMKNLDTGEMRWAKVQSASSVLSPTLTEEQLHEPLTSATLYETCPSAPATTVVAFQYGKEAFGPEDPRQTLTQVFTEADLVAAPPPHYRAQHKGDPQAIQPVVRMLTRTKEDPVMDPLAFTKDREEAMANVPSSRTRYNLSENYGGYIPAENVYTLNAAYERDMTKATMEERRAKEVSMAEFQRFLIGQQTDFLGELLGPTLMEEEKVRLEREALVRKEVEEREREQRRLQEAQAEQERIEAAKFKVGLWNTGIVGHVTEEDMIDAGPVPSEEEMEERKRRASSISPPRQQAQAHVAMQERIEAIWVALNMNDSARLAMAIKYANPAFGTSLEEAMDAWGAAVDVILEREDFLHVLYHFEAQVATTKSEEKRAKEQLREAKIRHVLRRDLEAHDAACLAQVRKVKQLCGDEITYDGELYTDKMTYDYSRIIFKVHHGLLSI